MEDNTVKIILLACAGITTTAAVAATISTISANKALSKAAANISSLSKMANTATNWAEETIANANINAQAA